MPTDAEDAAEAGVPPEIASAGETRPLVEGEVPAVPEPEKDAEALFEDLRKVQLHECSPPVLDIKCIYM